MPSSEQVVFTMNATHGLNIAIKSLVRPCGRVVVSGYEHNAVTRPLHALGAEVIVAAVHRVLERTPPELAADVAESGLLLTGGGSLLRGLDTLLAQRTGMEAHVAAAPIQSVALGLLETLPDLSKRKEGVLYLARRQWSL